MKVTKLTLSIIFTLVLLSLAVGAHHLLYKPNTSVSQQPMTKIKVVGIPAVHGLPFYVAMEKGWFREAGLDVEYTQIDSPNQVLDALLSGQADMTHTAGPLGIAGIANFKNPGSIRVYSVSGGNEQYPAEALMAKKDSGIKSFADLKGKKIGTLPGIQWGTITRHILQQNGLDADRDVTVVGLPMGLQAQSLAAGQVDAVLSIEPIPTVIKAKNIGVEAVRAPVVQFVTNPFYGGGGLVSSRFLTSNPEAVNKFIAVIARADQTVNENYETNRGYLKTYTPLGDDIIPLVPKEIFRMCSELSTEEIAAVQKFFNMFRDHGVIDGTADFASMIYVPPRAVE